MADERVSDAGVSFDIEELEYKHKLEIDKIKYQYEIDRIKFDYQNAMSYYYKHKEVALGGMINLSLSYSRYCLLVNAGAIVALLGLSGQLAAKDTAGATRLLGELSGAVTFFLLGVVAAALAVGLGYLHGFSFGGGPGEDAERSRVARVGWPLLQGLAITAGVASLALFLVGGWTAAEGLLVGTRHGSPALAPPAVAVQAAPAAVSVPSAGAVEKGGVEFGTVVAWLAFILSLIVAANQFGASRPKLYVEPNERDRTDPPAFVLYVHNPSDVAIWLKGHRGTVSSLVAAASTRDGAEALRTRTINVRIPPKVTARLSLRAMGGKPLLLLIFWRRLSGVHLFQFFPLVLFLRRSEVEAAPRMQTKIHAAATGDGD